MRTKTKALISFVVMSGLILMAALCLTNLPKASTELTGEIINKYDREGFFLLCNGDPVVCYPVYYHNYYFDIDVSGEIYTELVAQSVWDSYSEGQMYTFTYWFPDFVGRLTGGIFSIVFAVICGLLWLFYERESKYG